MNTTNIETLENRIEELKILRELYYVPNSIEFYDDCGGLTIAEIKNDHAVATISVKGGHLMNFRFHNQAPLLWLSPFAPLNSNKSIRGGVPVCWPWFGPHPTEPDSKPAHGFVRNAVWTVTNVQEMSGATQISLSLNEKDSQTSLWSYPLALQIKIIIGAQLQIELATCNTSNETITISEALHTYFAVSDVSKVSIHGLENCQYIDKVGNLANLSRQTQDGAITIRAETDRVYLNTTADCLIEDPGFRRKIRIAKEGSQSTVVWNPWIDKADRLGDFGYQGYLHTLCIETANAIDNVITMVPGSEHRLRAVISVETL